MAITLGSQFQVDTDGDDRVRFAGLTSSTGIALYSSAASGIEARHLTNSSGTITGGTVLAVDANAADTLCICRLTATTALIGYAYGSTHRVRILTVSGTTLSAASVTNMTDTGVTFADCDALTSTKVIYCYMSTTGTGDGVARVLTISGTTITENAAFTYENSFAAAHTAVGAFPDAISAIVFFDSNAEILDISGTTITGNSSHFESGISTGTTGDNHAALAIDPGDATVISIVACTGSNTGRIQRFIRSGGSLSASGSPIILTTGSNVTSMSITAIDSDRTIFTTLDPTNTQIIFQTFVPSTKTVADTDTSISVGAGASSTEISLLPGSTTAIAVWEGTTESITATLPAITDFDYVQSGSGNARNAIGVSQDGTFLFIALEEDTSGNQLIFKVARPTSTTPTTTKPYEPAGGSAGNVAQTGDPDRMVFHGNFGTDIGVIDHAITAGTNTDISPTSISAELIQPLEVDPDDIQHIVAINRNDQDALETNDTGGSWSTLNAALGQAVDAMALVFFGQYFPFGGFFGGNDGVDENLQYTPNEFNNSREDTSAALKAVGSIVSIDIALDT
jgi:hypothetical protein